MQKQQQKINSVCRFIAEFNHCQYGDSCRYLHPGQVKSKIFIEKVQKSSKNKRDFNKAISQSNDSELFQQSPLPQSHYQPSAPAPTPAPVYKINSMNDGETLIESMRLERGWKNRIKSQAKKIIFETIPEYSQQIVEKPPAHQFNKNDSFIGNCSMLDGKSTCINNERQTNISESNQNNKFQQNNVQKEKDQQIISQVNYQKQLERMLEGEFISIESITQDLTLIIKDKHVILYQNISPIIQEDIELTDHIQIQPLIIIPQTDYVIKIFYDILNQQIIILELNHAEKKIKFRFIDEVYSYLTHYNKQFNLFFILVLNIDHFNLGFFPFPVKNESQYLEPALIKNYNEKILSFQKTDSCLNINLQKGVIIEEFFLLGSYITKQIKQQDDNNNTIFINSTKNNIHSTEINSNNDINEDVVIIDDNFKSKSKKKLELSDNSSDDDGLDLDSSRFMKCKLNRSVLEYLTKSKNQDSESSKNEYPFIKNGNISMQSTTVSYENLQQSPNLNSYRQNLISSPELNESVQKIKENEIIQDNNSKLNTSIILDRTQTIKESVKKQTKTKTKSSSQPPSKKKSVDQKQKQPVKNTQKKNQQQQQQSKQKVDQKNREQIEQQTKKQSISVDSKRKPQNKLEKKKKSTSSAEKNKISSTSTEKNNENKSIVDLTLNEDLEKSKFLILIQEDDLFPDDSNRSSLKIEKKFIKQENLVENSDQKRIQFPKIVPSKNKQNVVITDKDNSKISNNKDIEIEIKSRSQSIERHEKLKKKVDNEALKNNKNDEFDIEYNLFPESPIKVNKSNDKKKFEKCKDQSQVNKQKDQEIPKRANEKENMIAVRSDIFLGSKKMQLVKYFKKEEISANLSKICKKNPHENNEKIVENNLQENLIIQEQVNQRNVNQTPSVKENSLKQKESEDYKEKSLEKAQNEKSSNPTKKKIIKINRIKKEENNNDYYNELNDINTRKQVILPSQEIVISDEESQLCMQSEKSDLYKSNTESICQESSSHLDFMMDDIEEINDADDERDDDDIEEITPKQYHQQQKNNQFLFNERLKQHQLRNQKQQAIQQENQIIQFPNQQLQNMSFYQPIADQMIMRYEQQQYQYFTHQNQNLFQPLQVNYTYQSVAAAAQNQFKNPFQDKFYQYLNGNRHKQLTDHELAFIELQKYQQIQQLIE